MRERVLAAARAAGRDPDGITCAYNLGIRVDERAEPRSDVVSGPPAAVVDRLAGFVALGFTALNLIPAGPDAPEQAHRIATEIIPAVRSVA